MDWSKPQDVSDLEIMFATSTDKLMPAWKDLPKCYRNMNNRRPSMAFVEEWFFLGLKQVKIIPREGVDLTKALRQLKACMGSFEPKHEHKVGGVGFLVDQFFEKAVTPKRTYEFSLEA